MAQRAYQQRIWKVSKDLDRLDLMCENHRLQIEHRKGLPDWTTPPRPAGVSSRRHTQAPTYFAWHEKSPERETPLPAQSEEPRQATPTTPQGVSTPSTAARTSLEPTSGVAHAGNWSGEVQYPPSQSVDTDETRLESTAVVTPRQSADPAEDEEKAEDTAISVDTSADPTRNDIPSADSIPGAILTRPVVVEDSPPPRRTVPSPRYKHGRRLQVRDQAVASHRAGISTREADRLRMLRSSGKVIRSPAKRSLLWDESPQSATNTYHHSSGRQRTLLAGNASDTFRTAYMDSYGWPRTESSRGERRPVLSGNEAMQVASSAAREFLGSSEEENCRPENQRNADQNDPSGFAGNLTDASDRASERTPVTRPITPYAPSSIASAKKPKTVSFAEDSTARAPISRAPGHVLIDSTTQTEDEVLLPVQIPRASKKQARPSSTILCDCCEAHRRHHTSDWCPVCGGGSTDPDDRPRKVRRTSTQSREPASPGPASSGPASPELVTHTQRYNNHHLTNPILTNPRYPPEPQIFRARSTYSTDFGGRPSWR